MRRQVVCALAGLFLGATVVAAQTDTRKERIEIPKGAKSTTAQGTIKGYESVDYQLQAAAGQTLTATFKSSNGSAYFNVLPPGSEEAIFIGSISGERFEGSLPATGVYTLRVYLMRNAARRDETAKYTLEVSLQGAAAGGAGGAGGIGAAFDRTLELQGIRFHVTQAGPKLRVAPAGLEIDNGPMERTVQGTVTGAEVADLNADSSPEVYVYVKSAGGPTELVAYSANRRKSLSEIHLPALTEAEAKKYGYPGQDELAVVESSFVRRFAVQPGPGTRQIQYKLVPGEAGWLLKVDRVVAY